MTTTEKDAKGIEAATIAIRNRYGLRLLHDDKYAAQIVQTAIDAYCAAKGVVMVDKSQIASFEERVAEDIKAHKLLSRSVGNQAIAKTLETVLEDFRATVSTTEEASK